MADKRFRMTRSQIIMENARRINRQRDAENDKNIGDIKRQLFRCEPCDERHLTSTPKQRKKGIAR